jgi:hypothetical protein
MQKNGLTQISRSHLTWSGVTVVLAVIGQISAVGHLIFVTHAKCKEHDELVHADPRRHTGPSTQYAPTLGKSEHISTSGKSDSESVNHEHCLLLFKHPKFAFAKAISAPFAHSTTPILAPDGDSVSPFVLPLYLFAPKNSPPV